MAQQANVYAPLGRWAEARKLLRTTLEIRIGALGEDHEEVAATMANLAAVCVLALPARARYLLARSRGQDAKVAAVRSDYEWMLRHTGREVDAFAWRSTRGEPR
jgi:hypothetical protein